MRHLIWPVALLITAPLTLAAEPTWFSEDFEEMPGSRLTGWTVETEDGSARVRRVGGAESLVMDFDSGEYETIRVYLRLQRGTGTVWFDEVRIDGLTIANAGFDQAEGNRLTGWGQDDVGEAIFWDPDHGRGDGCLRITRTAPGSQRRVWQNIPCEPKTKYRLTVWADQENLRGEAYAEVYGIKAGGLGRHLDSTPRLELPNEGRGERHLALHPRGGPVSVSHPLTAPEDRLLRLEADLKVSELDEGGDVRMAVVDQASGAELAGVTRAADPKAGGWARSGVNFVSPRGARPVVVITATARGGTACVDNLAVSPGRLTIMPQSARIGPISSGLTLPRGVLPEFRAPDSELIARGIALFAEVARERWGEFTDEVSLGPPVVIDVSGEEKPWPGNESYRLHVDADGGKIEAPTERGAFWGLMTLVDLLDTASGASADVLLVPACDINDRPAMPFRGTYKSGLPRDREERLSWCHRYARLKLNAVVIEDSIWFHLDDPENRKAAQEAFADFREWGIEPIPELQSGGWAGIQLAINPNVAEGKWQRDEKLTLAGTEPVALEHPNVIRTPSTDIVLTSEDKSVTYEEGRDYEVIPGEMKYVFRSDAAPFKVRRIADGRIPDGAVVLASYDWVSRVESGNCPYCPSEPLTYEIMIPAIENTINYLHPKYLHIGHDEPRVVNSDSRCLKRNLTGGQILAEDVRKLNDAAHEVDPDLQVMMWADALNPFHNGTWFKGEHEEELDLVPKDIIQNVWFYGATQPLAAGRSSFEHFQRFGFQFTGSPWDNVTCSHNWGVVAGEARRRGMNCLGLLYTSWSGRWDGLETLASVAWNPPRG